MKDPFITTGLWSSEPMTLTESDMLDAYRQADMANALRYSLAAWERRQYPLITLDYLTKEQPTVATYYARTSNYIVLYRFTSGSQPGSLAVRRVKATSREAAAVEAARTNWVGEIIAISDAAHDDFDVFLYEVETITPVKAAYSVGEDRLTEVSA